MEEIIQTFLCARFQYSKDVVEYPVVVSSGGAEDDRGLDVAPSLVSKFFLTEILFLFVVFGHFMRPDVLHVQQQVCRNLPYIAYFVNKRLVDIFLDGSAEQYDIFGAYVSVG